MGKNINLMIKSISKVICVLLVFLFVSEENNKIEAACVICPLYNFQYCIRLDPYTVVCQHSIDIYSPPCTEGISTLEECPSIG